MESSTMTTQLEHIEHTADGWFNFRNFYREIAEWIPDGGTWVEVGVYAGKSFSFGLIECLNREKTIDFIAVDIFPDQWIYDKRPDGPTVREKFDATMKNLKWHYVALAMPSVEAAAKFAPRSIDFVFIDAAHDFDNVMADIAAWLPKVREGGIIAGHDYDYYWRESVVKAVNQVFGDRVEAIPSDDDPKLFCWKVQL